MATIKPKNKTGNTKNKTGNLGKFRNFGLLVLSVFLLLTATLSSVSAQEEKLEVTVTAGPHLARVVAVNTNLAAGFISLAVYVTDANTGEVVSDAQVLVVAKNEKEEYEALVAALNSPAKPEQYDVTMNLGSTGEWIVAVDITSPLGRGGADALTFDVPSLNRYTSGSLVFFGIFAAMMLGVAYLFWSTKRDNRRRREAAQTESQAESQV
ncbi:MAG: hypothetical protein HQ475_13355 [SAR202 cluster bacterium]|nr:hypothetical protein [SAR202 cluster bacterium]